VKAIRWTSIGISILTGMVLLSTAQRLDADEGPKIGFVDMNSLTESYKTYKQNSEEFSQFVQRRQELLRQRVMLTEIEWQELDDLQSKDPEKLSDEEKQRKTELESLSAQRGKELRELQGVSEPSAEQRRRRQELEQIARANRQRIRDLDAKLSDEIRKKKADLLNGLQTQIRNAVATVAKEKGLSLVLEKDLALYADDALDITKEVTDRLNAEQ